MLLLQGLPSAVQGDVAQLQELPSHHCCQMKMVPEAL
jgi:hypothetical protein